MKKGLLLFPTVLNIPPAGKETSCPLAPLFHIYHLFHSMLLCRALPAQSLYSSKILYLYIQRIQRKEKRQSKRTLFIFREIKRNSKCLYPAEYIIVDLLHPAFDFLLITIISCWLIPSIFPSGWQVGMDG